MQNDMQISPSTVRPFFKWRQMDLSFLLDPIPSFLPSFSNSFQSGFFAFLSVCPQFQSLWEIPSHMCWCRGGSALLEGREANVEHGQHTHLS